MRILLRAGVVREFVFPDESELERYTNNLRGEYRILNKEERKGCLIVTIIQQYNSTPLWEV